MRTLPLIPLVLAALSPLVAAQDGMPTIAPPTVDASLPEGNWFDGSAARFGAGVGVKIIDGEDNHPETYYTVNVDPVLRFWKFQIALNLALDVDHQGQVREGMYDEPEDYLTMIKYFQFDRKKAPFYFKFGLMTDVNLGYRTIVNHFRSDVDYERQKVGGEIVVRSNLFGGDRDWWGFEAFGNNLLKAEVIGARPYLRPLAGLDLPIISNFEVGVTGVTDHVAPGYLLKDGGGLILSEGLDLPSDPKPNLDPDGNYQFTTRGIWVYGVDVGLPLFRSDSPFTLTPYADYSKNNVKGNNQFAKTDPLLPGARYFDDNPNINFQHSSRAYGLMFGVEQPFGLQVVLDGKLERRETSDGMIAGYFDTFYEIERFSYPNLFSLIPKRTALHQVPGTRGVYGDLAANILQVVTISGSYLDMEDQQQGTMTLNADVTAIEEVQLGAMFVKRNIGDLREAFTLDDQAFLEVHARFQLYSFTYLNLSFLRTWKFDDKTGEYEPIDVVTPGISVQFEF